MTKFIRPVGTAHLSRAVINSVRHMMVNSAIEYAARKVLDGVPPPMNEVLAKFVDYFSKQEPELQFVHIRNTQVVHYAKVECTAVMAYYPDDEVGIFKLEVFQDNVLASTLATWTQKPIKSKRPAYLFKNLKYVARLTPGQVSECIASHVPNPLITNGLELERLVSKYRSIVNDCAYEIVQLVRWLDDAGVAILPPHNIVAEAIRDLGDVKDAYETYKQDVSNALLCRVVDDKLVVANIAKGTENTYTTGTLPDTLRAKLSILNMAELKTVIPSVGTRVNESIYYVII